MDVKFKIGKAALAIGMACEDAQFQIPEKHEKDGLGVSWFRMASGYSKDENGKVQAEYLDVCARDNKRMPLARYLASTIKKGDYVCAVGTYSTRRNPQDGEDSECITLGFIWKLDLTEVPKEIIYA